MCSSLRSPRTTSAVLKAQPAVQNNLNQLQGYPAFPLRGARTKEETMIDNALTFLLVFILVIGAFYFLVDR